MLRSRILGAIDAAVSPAHRDVAHGAAGRDGAVAKPLSRVANDDQAIQRPPGPPGHRGVWPWKSPSMSRHRAVRRDRYPAAMSLQRLDNVGIVVDDMDTAVAFFTALGMEVEGRAHVAGLAVDQTVGLDGVHSDIVMMRTPDGRGRVELSRYHSPVAVSPLPENPPANTRGLHRIMFAVDDIDDTIARLRTCGAELLGQVAQYESTYRLCYLRGPASIIVALAQEIG